MVVTGKPQIAETTIIGAPSLDQVNCGGVARLQVGQYGGRQQLFRSLIRVDVSSIAGTVQHARLNLYVTSICHGDVACSTYSGPAQYSVFRMSKDWQEGRGGQGLTKCLSDAGMALPGETTWQSQSHPDGGWQTPGAGGAEDHAANSEAVVTVDNASAGHWIALDVTAGVQAFVTVPANNHGWLLVGDEGPADGGSRYAYFAATEFADGGSMGPYLEVTVSP